MDAADKISSFMWTLVFCIVALMAVGMLSILAVAGASTIEMNDPFIESRDQSPLMQLGTSFLLLVYGASHLYLIAFVLGVGFYRIVEIFRDDIQKAPEAIRKVLHTATRPGEGADK